MKPKISILDTQFSHTHPGSFGCGDLKTPPSYFDWDRTGKNINDLVVITEGSFFTVDSINYKTKVGLILEPFGVSPDIYNWIKIPENYQKFQYVLTHNKELLSVDDRFKYFTYGGVWILPSDQQIYQKTKNISIIASWKNQTEGHQLRHEVIKRFGDKIDVYGNGYNKVDYLLTALKDYKYTIVIENERREGFFTEKLVTAMRAACIPIYWGAPDICNYFEFFGMRLFEKIDDLNIIFEDIESGHHIQKGGIEENFKRAAQYCIPEDWLWYNFFKPLNLVP